MACNIRCTLIVFCVIQLIAITEKQVFDILCFLWTPILLNTLHIALTITVLVGVCRYIHKILVIYSVWCLVWLAWNSFVICFYYEVGILNAGLPVMNLGYGRTCWLPGGMPGCSSSRTNCDANIPDLENATDLPDPTLVSRGDVTRSIEGDSNASIFPYTEVDYGDGTLLSEPSSTSSTRDDDVAATDLSTPDELATTDVVVDGGEPEVAHLERDAELDSVSSLSDRSNSSSGSVGVSRRAVQAAHAIVQSLLAVICFVLTCTLAYIYSEEEDSFDFISGSLLTPNEKNLTQRYQLKAVYVSASSP